MSSEIDPRYLQIIFCYYDVAQKVVRKYTELQMQKYSSDWRDFLNKNIHDIYHLWIHDTRCCQCPEAHSEVLYQRDRVLRREQIELMFKIDGPETTGHCIRDKRRKQYCLCKVSVKTSSTIESIDVPLLVSVFMNCVQTKSDYNECRTIFEDLRDVRNTIAHVPNTKMAEENFKELWGKLTNAILTLAENIPSQPEFYAEIKREIHECQEKSGSLEQIRIAMKFLLSQQQQQQQVIFDVQDSVKSIKRTLSGYFRDCEGIQLEGYLDLRKLTVITFKHYKPFWFVLNSPGWLQYYEEKPKPGDEVQALKTLNILKFLCIESKGDALFNVVVGKEKLKLRAASKVLKEKWITAINALQARPFKLSMSDYRPNSLGETEAHDETPGTLAREFKELAITETKRNSERMSQLFEDTKKPMRVVAAIDFGTSSSGAAFSSRKSFDSDPLKIEIIQLNQQQAFQKTQTSVLFIEEKFEAFGEQAEYRFKNTSSKQKMDNNMLFFKTFKMQLHSAKLTKSTKLRSYYGKEMKCDRIIAACIEHIKITTLERIIQLHPNIQEERDVHWVLTVPAIWSEEARQFMIKAAVKTGIDICNLSLALEPECAALHCKHDLWMHADPSDSTSDPFASGSQFMVVDLGGGTVDITVSEVLKSDQIKEISKASGGKWGGDTINKKIMEVLKEVFGKELQHVRSEKHSAYLKLVTDIEAAKRAFNEKMDLLIPLPRHLQDKFNPANIPQKYKKDIEIGGDDNENLNLSAELAIKIFEDCISGITKHVEGLLKAKARGVSVIILVGGYASSKFVHKAFRKMLNEKFKMIQLIRPQNPEISVLTGAVISGHSINPIVGRVAKYNYGLGIKASKDFGEDNLLVADDSKEMIFHLLIEKNRKMEVGKYVESCKIKVENIKQLNRIEFYITENDFPPEKVNENDFKKIGTLKFGMPQLEKPTIFEVSIWYDETEFRVLAKVKNEIPHFEGIIQCLD